MCLPCNFLDTDKVFTLQKLFAFRKTHQHKKATVKQLHRGKHILELSHGDDKDWILHCSHRISYQL